MNYIQINSDEELLKAIEVLNSKERIAVDFEGEFNLHVYGEHLCLIQVYDGDVFYIIDPRSKALTVKGLEAFFFHACKESMV
jgi:ribonuclease D